MLCIMSYNLSFACEHMTLTDTESLIRTLPNCVLPSPTWRCWGFSINNTCVLSAIELLLMVLTILSEFIARKNQ